MASKLLVALVVCAILLSNFADAKPRQRKQKKSGNAVKFTNYGPFFSLPVVVGSQKTKLNVGVDGFYGSSVVYGPGAACDGSDSYCVQHDTFDQTKSSSFKPASNGREFEFTLGTAHGVSGGDDYSVGSLSLKDTMFGILTSIPRYLNRKTKNSGHIAMWSPKDAEDDKTTMQKLVELNSVKTVTFSAPSDSNGLHTVTFGGDDTKNCKKFTSYPNQPHLSKDEEISPWTIQFSSFKWGSYSKTEAVNIAMNVASDYFVAPKRHANYIYNQLGAKYNYDYSGGMVDCSKRSSAPNLEFSANGKTYVVTPNQYIKAFDSSNCLLNIYPDELNQWTLPYMFHQTYCVKYDYGAKTVGIADKK
ncbi:Cathepsin D-like [Aphelenchoides bicaudatus]|nr:Cathepsin D-like [Aphelenchoides bicaudatus]